MIRYYYFRIVLWYNNDEESIAKSKLENKSISSYISYEISVGTISYL